MFGIDMPIENCIEMLCSQQQNNFESGLITLANLRMIVNYFVLVYHDIPFADWYLHGIAFINLYLKVYRLLQYLLDRGVQSYFKYSLPNN